MTRTRGALLAILAVLAAVWGFSSAPLPMARAARVPGAASSDRVSSDAPSRFELDEVAARLGRGLQSVAAPRPPLRNPFRFATAAPASREPAAATPVPLADASPLEPVAVEPTLIGIVERTIDGRSVRVAVLSMAGELSYAAAGDRVGSDEVVAVDADAIEIKRGRDGTTRRLALR